MPKRIKWIVVVLLVAAGAAMVFGQDVQAQTRALSVAPCVANAPMLQR
jgi:hypothetical protein